jgi:hypothetical protein
MTDTSDEGVRHLSSFHCELLRLGEVSAAERKWMEEHLRSCAACTALSGSFEASRREFAGAVATRTGAQLRARVEQARRRRWRWVGVGLLVPVAATFLVVLSGRGPRPPEVAEPEFGVKGGPGLLVAARRGSRVFPVSAKEPLRAGDQIRFVLDSVRHPFLMIASVDGAGHANIYVPYEGKESLAVEAKGQQSRIEIPGSIIIDETPGPERLFAFLSQRPIEAAKVRAALAKLAAGGPAAIRTGKTVDVGAEEQVSMLLEKAPP